MPLQVTIPEKDPLISQLERRANRRYSEPNRKRLRKRLPELARELLRERLRDLQERGDPMELPAAGSG